GIRDGHVTGVQTCALPISPGPLTATQQADLEREAERFLSAGLGPEDVQLGGEKFLSTSVELAPGGTPAVSLSVLKSYDQATAFRSEERRVGKACRSQCCDI